MKTTCVCVRLCDEKVEPCHGDGCGSSDTCLNRHLFIYSQGKQEVNTDTGGFGFHAEVPNVASHTPFLFLRFGPILFFSELK